MCGRELWASSRNLTVMQAILCPLPRLRVSYPQIFVSNSVGGFGADGRSQRTERGSGIRGRCGQLLSGPPALRGGPLQPLVHSCLTATLLRRCSALNDPRLFRIRNFRAMDPSRLAWMSRDFSARFVQCMGLLMAGRSFETALLTRAGHSSNQ